MSSQSSASPRFVVLLVKREKRASANKHLGEKG